MRLTKQQKRFIVAESMVDLRTLDRFLKKKKIRDDSRVRIEAAMKKLEIGR